MACKQLQQQARKMMMGLSYTRLSWGRGLKQNTYQRERAGLPKEKETFKAVESYRKASDTGFFFFYYSGNNTGFLTSIACCVLEHEYWSAARWRLLSPCVVKG